MLQSFSVYFSALLILLCCGNCKKSDSKDSPGQGSGSIIVSISPSIVTLKNDQRAYGALLTVELKNARSWESKEVVWTSENPRIVSVRVDGTVWAEAAGETYIVAALVSGKGIAKCKVIVTD